MRTGDRRERGVTLAATAVWLGAILALMAIAVEVARLTDTATEVQIAADSGALGAAVAIANRQPDQAVARGKSVAAANFADGRPVDPGSVQIEIGHYDSAANATPHFSPSCTPGVDCNAAKATVTVDNVQYIVASILGGAATSVQKNAVAAAECQGSARPLPLAVCKDVLNSIPHDDLCGTTAPSLFMNPNTGDNACWTSLGTASASSSYEQGIFPPQCGGVPLETSLQEPINLQNGVANKVWQALQCCIACQNVHDFTVPVVDCSAMGSCNTAPPVLGFATIRIALPTDVNPPGGGNTNCGSGDFSPWGCSARVSTAGSTGITASQVCRSGGGGKAGGPNCTNFGDTVIPVLGQLP